MQQICDVPMHQVVTKERNLKASWCGCKFLLVLLLVIYIILVVLVSWPHVATCMHRCSLDGSGTYVKFMRWRGLCCGGLDDNQGHSAELKRSPAVAGRDHDTPSRAKRWQDLLMSWWQA